MVLTSALQPFFVQNTQTLLDVFEVLFCNLISVMSVWVGFQNVHSDTCS